MELIVNGVKRQVKAPQGTLLKYLREELGLMGAKNGCGNGQCGACTVIINGRAVRSCTQKLERLEGAVVETIENLPADGSHPIQRAFLQAGAVQCGFCTPGIIMTVKALLDQNLSPTEAEVRRALKNNLCRCTGYYSILRAVQMAAAWMRGEKTPPEETPQGGRAVGRALPNVEVQKVTGAPIFTDDLARGEALYGKLVFASQPHGVLTGLDVKAASQVPGVVRVFTAPDVPGSPVYGALKADHPVFVGVGQPFRFIGDVLALVVAESEKAAEAGAAAVKMEYTPLPLVDSVEASLKPGAPSIGKDGNILNAVKIRKGDVEAGFAASEVTVEGSFSTPFIEHAYLETEAVYADYDGHRLTVKTGGQCPHSFRQMIASCLGLAEEKVRVINMDTGGAFGGKVEPTIQIQCALAAYLLGRPVKMTSSRKESMLLSTKRHAVTMKYRLGATRDGRLTAGQVELYGDTGPYASVGGGVIFRASTTALGPYRYDTASIDGYAVLTNNCIGGAMRGYGSPQTCFACEVMMDELAQKLDMDPLDLRLKNALRPGDLMVTGERIQHSVGIVDCLERLKQRLAQGVESTLDPAEYDTALTMACSFKNVGIGGGVMDGAGATAVLHKDGTLQVWTGAAEIGQGTRTAMGQIAADAFGIPVERVRVMLPDTLYTLDAGVTTSSRQTFVSGNAVKQAATALRDKVRNQLAQALDVPAGEIDIQSGSAVCRGKTYALDEVARRLQVGEEGLQAQVQYLPPQTYDLPVNASCNENLPPEETRIHAAYSFGAQAVLVGVHRETGAVKIDKVIAAHDVGYPINPLMIQGQLEGGIVMAVGYAMAEQYPMKGGYPQVDTLRELHLPMVDDIPGSLECMVVEDPHPEGPFGAKGMGELVMNPAVPALACALSRLTGQPHHHLPLGKTIQRK